MKYGVILKTASLALAVGAGLVVANLSFGADEKAAAAGTQTIKGEVVDLMCYLDHGAKGEAHKACAEKCIKSGGPVGILSGDQVYLVIGDHAPIRVGIGMEMAEMAASAFHSNAGLCPGEPGCSPFHCAGWRGNPAPRISARAGTGEARGDWSVERGA